MNEIVPESPEIGTANHDENVYVPSTPQKAGTSPPICKRTPTLGKARKSLSALENNTELQSPTKRPCKERLFASAGAERSSRLKNYGKDKLSNLQKVRVSLFHDRLKEKEAEEKKFCLNTKSFYGSLTDIQNVKLAPEIKPDRKKSTRKKRSPVVHYSTHKQPVRRNKKGEINGGVGHGIKKPKRKRSSLKNDSMESVEQNRSFDETENESSMEKNNQSTITSGNIGGSPVDTANKYVVEEKYDPSKKFFKYKSSIKINFSKKNESLNLSKSEKTDKAKPIAMNYLAKRREFLNSLKKNIEDNVCNTEQITKEDASPKNNKNINESVSCNVPQNNSNEENVIETTALQTENSDNQFEIENNTKEYCKISTKEKDINDLLKLLEDDWNDDTQDDVQDNTQLEDRICNEKNIFTLENQNSISEDVIETLTFDHVQDNVNINISNLKNSEENILCNIEKNKEATEHTDEKYYPIFYKGISSNIALEETNVKKKQNTTGQWKQNDEMQYQIDAGQQMFGATQCKECNLVYHIGDVDDEKVHLKYHNSFDILKFHGWKNEHVLYEDSTNMSRVILVEPKDPSLHREKVMKVLQLINNELGIPEAVLSECENKKFYLYVKDKTILGILVAEHVNSAFKMIPDLYNVTCRTSESSSVMCGVYAIWTKKNHRRQGVATKLLDILRTNFFYGYVMSIEDIAFSIPTPSGKLFAEKYTKTSSFKVY